MLKRILILGYFFFFLCRMDGFSSFVWYMLCSNAFLVWWERTRFLVLYYIYYILLVLLYAVMAFLSLVSAVFTFLNLEPLNLLSKEWSLRSNGLILGWESADYFLALLYLTYWCLAFLTSILQSAKHILLELDRVLFSGTKWFGEVSSPIIDANWRVASKSVGILLFSILYVRDNFIITV